MSPDAQQRWRCYLRLPAAAVPEDAPGGARGWARLFTDAGLPMAGEESGRGRVAPAAQLPLGVSGEREVVDLVLTRRMPIARVRELVAGALPPTAELVDLHDVWLGAPAAPAAVVAADYEVAAVGPEAAALRAAVGVILGAETLPRQRQRDRAARNYDLRPLIVSLDVADWDDLGADGPAGLLRMRLAHGPAAVGRPEEVVAALADLLVAAGALEPARSATAPEAPIAAVPRRPLVARRIRRLAVVMADD